MKKVRGRCAAISPATPSIARKNGTGFILESATWRASRDWGDVLGYTPEELDDANREGDRVAAGTSGPSTRPHDSPMVISGCIGPRGDGYDPGKRDERRTRPKPIMRGRSASSPTSDADMVSAITMTYVDEAIGVTRAAQAAGMPVVDLVHGRDRRQSADRRKPRRGDHGGRPRDRQRRPAYYMINCAHPTHFESRVDVRRGLGRADPRRCRANASRCSHAELDGATELDDGNPAELGRQYREHARPLPADQRSGRLLRHRPSSHRADRDELHRDEGGISHVQGECRRPGMFPAAATIRAAQPDLNYGVLLSARNTGAAPCISSESRA